MQKEQEALLKAIDIMIEQRLKNLNFNYYVDGVIKEKKENGTYGVLINGTIYNNIIAKNGFEYSVGDTVQVLIKNGNWNKKFIDGKTTHNNDVLLDSTHPVGSIYVTSTNTTPATILGGAWELFDKDFKPLTYYISNSTTNTNYFTANFDNISKFSAYIERVKNNIHIRLGFATKVEFNDNEKIVGNFNLETFGLKLNSLNSYLPAMYYFVGQSDGGNSCVMGYMKQDTGNIAITDVIGYGTNVISADKNVYIQFVYPIPLEYMDDSACDKFYWKRIA